MSKSAEPGSGAYAPASTTDVAIIAEIQGNGPLFDANVRPRPMQSGRSLLAWYDHWRFLKIFVAVSICL